MVLIVDAAKGDPEIDMHERVLSAGCALQNFMLLANAMGYVSILTSILFTYYFYRKLVSARAFMGGAQ